MINHFLNEEKLVVFVALCNFYWKLVLEQIVLLLVVVIFDLFFFVAVAEEEENLNIFLNENNLQQKFSVSAGSLTLLAIALEC